MEKRIERVRSNFNDRKNNCAQAIACAYCDVLGIDENTAFAIFEGLGGGVGGSRNTCGAVTAMAAVISAVRSDGQLSGSTSKADTYKSVSAALDRFKEIYGSVNCRAILRGDIPRHINCLDKVENVSRILDEILADK